MYKRSYVIVVVCLTTEKHMVYFTMLGTFVADFLKYVYVKLELQMFKEDIIISKI